MTSYNGPDRRNGKSEDHDLLIKIDTNLSNFMKSFDNHTIEDDMKFKITNENLKDANKKIEFLNNRYWMVVGALLLIEVIARFFKWVKRSVLRRFPLYYCSTSSKKRRKKMPIPFIIGIVVVGLIIAWGIYNKLKG